MSCLSVIAKRVGGLLSVAETRIGGIVTAVTRIADFTVSATKAGGMGVTATRVAGMTCRIGLVCSTGLGDPDVLWASDGKVFNVLGKKIYITVKR